MQYSQKSLDFFFRPKSIAILGASSDPTKIGGRPIRYLQMAGFSGRILPINPERHTVQDLPAFARIEDVDGDVDLAIVAVPAAQVPNAIRACVGKGVKAATVFSAGFAETGQEGERLQREILSAAAGRMRILGPNCMGTVNTANGAFATFTSSIISTLPPRGRVSLATQSGAIGAHCLVMAQDRGLGINLWGTTGNQSDVDISEFLAYMAADPDTDVVLACLEGIRDPQQMIEAFRIARRNRKPVVMLKVGRSDVGIEAAASHTASLAGSDAAFDAVLKENGVHRASSLDELFDIVYACSFNRFPRSRRMGVLTFSGGAGILMADAAADEGLDLAPLPEATQSRIKDLLPFAGARNPVDTTAQVINNPDLVEAMFGTMMTDGGYDSAIAFFSHVGRSEKIMSPITPGLQRVANANPDSFMAIASLTTPLVRESFEKAGFAVFDDPSRAVHAASILCRFRETFDAAENDAGDRCVGMSAAIERGSALSEHESRDILSRAGIPFVPARIVTTPAAAAAAGKEFGFPVAMKIVSNAIPHKSEIGGVLLDVGDEVTASAAFDTLMERGVAAAKGAPVDGILVSPMVRHGVELILGTSTDPVFGPMVMVGLGGIFVEIFKDVELLRAPFGPLRAKAALSKLKGYPLLEGARGTPRSDVDALVAAMVALSQFAAANAEDIQSIDINPIVALPEGRGVVALDALIVPKAS